MVRRTPMQKRKLMPTPKETVITKNMKLTTTTMQDHHDRTIAKEGDERRR
jgi:hypothetical protein